MHYTHTETTVGALAYSVLAFLIWFFVIQKGDAAPTNGALIFLGIFWILSTLLALSFIESRHSSPKVLVGGGAFLIAIGATAAALSLVFGPEEWFKLFFSNAILLLTASAGVNFLAQGAVELTRGVTSSASPAIATSTASSQNLIVAGFILFLAGLGLATLSLYIMPTDVFQFFSNLFLLGGGVGMCLASQGIVGRGRHGQTPSLPHNRPRS